MRFPNDLTILLLVGFIFATARGSHALLQGTTVSAHDPLAKSVVGIFENYEGRVWISNCAGSVLSDQFILTAAHCLTDNTPQNFLVNFSADQILYDRRAEMRDAREIENKFDVRKVKAFKTHPNFNLDRKGDHDVAVILLQDPAPSSAIPVKLMPSFLLDPTTRSTTLEQTVLPTTLFGAGTVDEKNNTKSGVMRSVTVPGRFEKQLVITDQTSHMGACSGDSGGPAFAKLSGQFYQVGIISRPHGDSKTCHESGQLINPAIDGDFIEKAIEELLETN